MGTTAPPLITLWGAPHTGLQLVAQALRQRIAPDIATLACPDLLPGGFHPLGVGPGAPTAAPPTTAATGIPQRLGALTLLMGLDLPCPPDERRAQEAADAQLRTALQHAEITYHVVYGQGERRIDNALIAIKKVAASAYPTSARAAFDSTPGHRTARLRPLNCEKCSDPECEHRLFTRLTDARSGASVAVSLKP